MHCENRVTKAYTLFSYNCCYIVHYINACVENTIVRLRTEASFEKDLRQDGQQYDKNDYSFLVYTRRAQLTRYNSWHIGAPAHLVSLIVQCCLFIAFIKNRSVLHPTTVAKINSMPLNIVASFAANAFIHQTRNIAERSCLCKMLLKDSWKYYFDHFCSFSRNKLE